MTGFLKIKTPLMIAVGGLSGSGKTSLAEELGKRIRGAVVLDSDVVHKKLRKVDPKSPLPEQAYSQESIKEFIRHIHREAAKHLREGKTVIVTGTFLDLQHRLKQQTLAQKNGAGFIGIYLHAPASVLFDRVASRKDSVSDADKKVLKRQITNLQQKLRDLEDAERNTPRPFHHITWQIINADQPIESMLKSAVQYIHQEAQKFQYPNFPPPPPRKAAFGPK